MAKNTIYPLTNVVYNILASSFSLSWAAWEAVCTLWAGTPRGLLPYVLINDMFLVEFDFYPGKPDFSV